MKAKIEKNKKIPIGRTRPYKYPWEELNVGDSFLLEHGGSPTALVNNYNLRLPVKKRIVIKTVKEKSGKRRVWRIK